MGNRLFDFNFAVVNGPMGLHKTIMPLGELPVSCLVFLVFLACPPKPWLVLVEAQAYRGLSKGRLVVPSRTWQCSKTSQIESRWDSNDYVFLAALCLLGADSGWRRSSRSS